MTYKATPEKVVPPGYEKLENHAYVLPGIPRKYFVVTATKAGEA
jgi:hypothetical protein